MPCPWSHQNVGFSVLEPPANPLISHFGGPGAERAAFSKSAKVGVTTLSRPRQMPLSSDCGLEQSPAFASVLFHNPRAGSLHQRVFSPKHRPNPTGLAAQFCFCVQPGRRARPKTRTDHLFWEMPQQGPSSANWFHSIALWTVDGQPHSHPQKRLTQRPALEPK